MNETRFDQEVAGGTLDGRRWCVVERGFDVPDKILDQMPDLLHRWYCSYVELLLSDYYWSMTADAEYDLPVPGGITFLGSDPAINHGKKSVGFDTAHYGMDYTQQQVTNETIELAKLLNSLDGRPYD